MSVSTDQRRFHIITEILDIVVWGVYMLILAYRIQQPEMSQTEKNIHSMMLLAIFLGILVIDGYLLKKWLTISV